MPAPQVRTAKRKAQEAAGLRGRRAGIPRMRKPPRVDRCMQLRHIAIVLDDRVRPCTPFAVKRLSCNARAHVLFLKAVCHRTLDARLQRSDDRQYLVWVRKSPVRSIVGGNLHHADRRAIAPASSERRLARKPFVKQLHDGLRGDAIQRCRPLRSGKRLPGERTTHYIPTLVKYARTECTPQSVLHFRQAQCSMPRLVQIAHRNAPFAQACHHAGLARADAAYKVYGPWPNRHRFSVANAFFPGSAHPPFDTPLVPPAFSDGGNSFARFTARSLVVTATTTVSVRHLPILHGPP